MKLHTLKKLFIELRDYLELYKDNSIIDSYRIVKNTVEVLESNESKKFKLNYVINAYKSLYIGKSGLTEYYIWNDDYDTRIKLNEPLDRIRNDLWNIMKFII